MSYGVVWVHTAYIGDGFVLCATIICINFVALCDFGILSYLLVVLLQFDNDGGLLGFDVVNLLKMHEFNKYFTF